MRSVITILLLLIFIMGLIADDVTKSVISVRGMKDKSCVEKISKALDDIDGVENVLVNLESGLVTIEHNDVDLVSMNSAIVKAGFKTSHKDSEKIHKLETEGKSCSEAEREGCNKPCERKDN